MLKGKEQYLKAGFTLIFLLTLPHFRVEKNHTSNLLSVSSHRLVASLEFSNSKEDRKNGERIIENIVMDFL